MTLSMKEKKILYAFACPSHHNTVTRLKWLTALTVDPEAKRRMLGLVRKMETEVDESWYEAFYHHLRMEMDEYRRLKRSLRVLKSYTDYSWFTSGSDGSLATLDAGWLSLVAPAYSAMAECAGTVV